jgi:uncharacterized protein (TIGR03086 family)
MSFPDLEPATRRTSKLIGELSADQLGRPTPCPAYALGDLVEHVGSAAPAFTGAAEKDMGDITAGGAAGDGARLATDWQTHIPRDLGGLADAWRNPDAWTGMTRVGGVELPGEVAGLFALDEVVIHGWDIAMASGQPFECEPELLEALHGLLLEFAIPGEEAGREGLFGPVIRVPDNAPLLDRVLGLTGRDPNWSEIR